MYCKLLALLSVVVATTAVAQEATPAGSTPFLTLSGTAAVTSDYRFRGVSQTDRDVAVQASLTATTEPGVFVGIWGSSIDSKGGYLESDGSLNSGSHQEIDLTGGYSRTFGAITPTVGAIGYVYPGGHGVDFVEVFGTVAGALGPAAVSVGVNYAPSQGNLTEDNLYVYGLAAYALPGTPFTIKASVGRTKGALDYGRTKIDYMAGIDYRFRILTFSLQYIGNDVPNYVPQPLRHDSRNGIVGSVTAAF